MEQTSLHGCGNQADRPTQILSDEHRIIEQVLDALQQMIKTPAVESLERWQKALDFIRHFADQCHHCKEEKVLFPAMEQHGIPNEGGPIGMMLMEHEEGRAHVRAMFAALARIEVNDETAQATLFENAKNYARLLREHIQKEDEVLFRIADDVLPVDQQKELLRAFAEHEAKEIGAGEHQKFVAIAEELGHGLV
jgi:hemerythrin-like domain-containing protein